jgi:hypothetical protein
MRSRCAVLVAAAGSLALTPTALGAAPALELPDATSIATLPATVTGTTDGSKLAAHAPHPACARSNGVVWYELRARRHAAVVLRLRAHGKLEGAVAVYHLVRSHVTPVTCARTNARGRASTAFYASMRGSYLVAVARATGSADSSFALDALPAEPAARPPGKPLPRNGVHTTLNAVLNPTDAWSVELARGATYRFNVSSRACVGMQLYRPGIYSFAASHAVLETACGGYRTFTPGADGGGRYTILVTTGGTGTATQPYLLSFAPAERDDMGPGVTLANGTTVDDRISGRGIDNVDLYRITVPRDHEQTTVDFREKPATGMDLLLLREDGTHIRCACETNGAQRLREVLPAGHYFVVVRSRHDSGGAYSLGVVTRDITATKLSAVGGTLLGLVPGAPVTFTVAVAQAHDGGPLALEIQRFDPLTRWQFSTLYRQRIGPDGLFITTWTPPSVGRWRAHARFFGTRFSSFSESGWLQLRVSEPLG